MHLTGCVPQSEADLPAVDDDDGRVVVEYGWRVPNREVIRRKFHLCPISPTIYYGNSTYCLQKLVDPSLQSRQDVNHRQSILTQ
jgi:hypothetical protein